MPKCDRAPQADAYGTTDTWAIYRTGSVTDPFMLWELHMLFRNVNSFASALKPLAGAAGSKQVNTLGNVFVTKAWHLRQDPKLSCTIGACASHAEQIKRPL